MSLPTRALTLKQPWLWYVLNASLDPQKLLENRSRRIMNWREWDPPGEFWLHAGKGDTPEYWSEAIAWVRARFGPDFPVPSPDAVPRYGIVGRARIIGMVTPDGKMKLERGEPIGSRPNFERAWDMRWHMTGQHAYVLADVEATPLVVCAGAQGFWPVPRRILEQLEEQAA
jgi:hypothetical protein